MTESKHGCISDVTTPAARIVWRDDTDPDDPADVEVDQWLFSVQIGPFQLNECRQYPLGPCFADGDTRFAVWRCDNVRCGVRRPRSNRYVYSEYSVEVGGIYTVFNGPSHVLKSRVSVPNVARRELGWMIVRAIVVARHWRKEEISVVVTGSRRTGDWKLLKMKCPGILPTDLGPTAFPFVCSYFHLGPRLGTMFIPWHDRTDVLRNGPLPPIKHCLRDYDLGRFTESIFVQNFDTDPRKITTLPWWKLKSLSVPSSVSSSQPLSTVSTSDISSGPALGTAIPCATHDVLTTATVDRSDDKTPRDYTAEHDRVQRLIATSHKNTLLAPHAAPEAPKTPLTIKVDTLSPLPKLLSIKSSSAKTLKSDRSSTSTSPAMSSSTTSPAISSSTSPAISSSTTSSSTTSLSATPSLTGSVSSQRKKIHTSRAVPHSLVQSPAPPSPQPTPSSTSLTATSSPGSRKKRKRTTVEEDVAASVTSLSRRSSRSHPQTK
jgi:hypothetical protein